MDAFKRAKAFIATQSATDTDGGISGISGISRDDRTDGGVFPLSPLIPQLRCAEGRQPDHPRSRDRSTWTPYQRQSYVSGLIVALTALRQRLERGRIVLDSGCPVAVEVHWFVLASRAMRLIAKIAQTDRNAELVFLGSELGRWYSTLDWPMPSAAARLLDWSGTTVPRSRSP